MVSNILFKKKGEKEDKEDGRRYLTPLNSQGIPLFSVSYLICPVFHIFHLDQQLHANPNIIACTYATLFPVH